MLHELKYPSRKLFSYLHAIDWYRAQYTCFENNIRNLITSSFEGGRDQLGINASSFNEAFLARAIHLARSTHSTDRQAGTGSANHVARHFKTNARRPLHDRVQLSHARAAATFASSRARAADFVTPDLVARLSARRRSRAAFSSRVREKTFDAAKRAFVGPRYVEHARQKPFSGSYRPCPDSARSFPARARRRSDEIPSREMRRDSTALSRYRRRSSIVGLAAVLPARERMLDYRKSRGLTRSRQSGVVPRLGRSGNRKLAANGSNPLFFITVRTCIYTCLGDELSLRRGTRVTCSWYSRKQIVKKCQEVVTKNWINIYEKARKELSPKATIGNVLYISFSLDFINYNLETESTFLELLLLNCRHTSFFFYNHFIFYRKYFRIL